MHLNTAYKKGTQKSGKSLHFKNYTNFQKLNFKSNMWGYGYAGWGGYGLGGWVYGWCQIVYYLGKSNDLKVKKYKF